MSLTMGSGPFGWSPAGRFDFSPPDHVVYVEAFPRRVRAVLGGEVVVESDDVKMVHESGRLPRWSFPRRCVGARVASADDPHVDGHVTVPWGAVDGWFEEDERVFVHPRDPYHRVDVVGTSRRVRVSASASGEVLAESTRAKALYETGLPVRWYLPPADVRMDLLVSSTTVTECAYKGSATHWSAVLGDGWLDDVAWSYEREVWREAESVGGLLAFYTERRDLDLDVDGVRQERPRTPWSD